MMADSDFPHGRRYYTKSGYFKHLDHSTINLLVHAAATIPSSDTMIELAYLGGAAGQVAADETAFGDRSAPFVLTLLADWTNLPLTPSTSPGRVESSANCVQP